MERVHCAGALEVFRAVIGSSNSHLLTRRCGEAASDVDVETTLEMYAKALGLQEKLDALCNTLSGGQKRRLWCCTALLGDTPLVILDEPTSGMDPQSRRDFWLLLKDMAQRDGRAIMFSTHYLEE